MSSNGPWNPPNRYPQQEVLTNPDGTPIPSQWTPSPPPTAAESGSVLIVDFCGIGACGPKPPGWILGGGGLAR